MYPEKMAALARHEKEAYTASHPLKERLCTAFTEIYEHFTKDTYHPANLIAIAVIALGLALCAARSRRSLGLGLSFWCSGSVTGAIWATGPSAGACGLCAVFYGNLLVPRNLVSDSGTGGERRRNGAADRQRGKICPGSIVLTFGIFCVLTLTAANTWRSVQSYNTGRPRLQPGIPGCEPLHAEHPENVTL